MAAMMYQLTISKARRLAMGRAGLEITLNVYSKSRVKFTDIHSSSQSAPYRPQKLPNHPFPRKAGSRNTMIPRCPHGGGQGGLGLVVVFLGRNT